MKIAALDGFDVDVIQDVELFAAHSGSSTNVHIGGFRLGEKFMDKAAWCEVIEQLRWATKGNFKFVKKFKVHWFRGGVATADTVMFLKGDTDVNPIKDFIWGAEDSEVE